MGPVRAVTQGFFPLDEELGLLAGQRTSSLHEAGVRLGSLRPFAVAAETLACLTGTFVSEAPVRRLCQAAGAAQVTLDELALTQPQEPTACAMAVQGLRLDGAMVPLVGGEWAEVKTLTIGEVQTESSADGPVQSHTQALSDCSRVREVERFRQVARVEVQRRGPSAAEVVCAVSDGALWIQGVVDDYRRDAVRILDFPMRWRPWRAPGKPISAARAAYHQWLAQQRQTLFESNPQRVVDALQHLAVEAENQPDAVQATIDESWRYLQTRLPMLDYARFRALGYPIASGAAESANTLVVERRLKGAGMHWARAHVHPMLAPDSPASPPTSPCPSCTAAPTPGATNSF